MDYSVNLIDDPKSLLTSDPLLTHDLICGYGITQDHIIYFYNIIFRSPIVPNGRYVVITRQQIVCYPGGSGPVKTKWRHGYVINNIIGNFQVLSAFIEKHTVALSPAGIDGHIMDDVTGNPAARLTPQAIDPAPVTEDAHNVVYVIIGNDIFPAGSGNGIPHPTDRDPRIREIT